MLRHEETVTLHLDVLLILSRWLEEHLRQFKRLLQTCTFVACIILFLVFQVYTNILNNGEYSINSWLLNVVDLPVAGEGVNGSFTILIIDV